MSNLIGAPLDFNTHQKAAEILRVVLDELKGVFLAASQLIFSRQLKLVSCNTCFCSSESEKKLDIFILPVPADIHTSIKQFLKPEMLSSQNKWICPSCSGLSERTRETFIKNSALIFIIQLCRFSNRGRQLIKDENFLSCTQSEWNKDLAVPTTVEDEVSFTKKYCVIATSNHSSTLYMGSLLGFYQRLTFIFLVLLQCQQNYIIHLFLQQSLNVPQDLPKLFTVLQGVLSFQTLCLGVMTPNITPALNENWLC